MKLCLVASSGGHLMELFSLRDAWQDCDERVWVTFPTQDALSLLENEEVRWAYYPTNRNLWNLVRNIGFAWQFLRQYKPDVIISTGAGVGVPFIWIGAILNIQTIFIESITFTNQRSLSGKLVYSIVDRYLVQWPELAEKYSKAQYRGQVL